MNDQEIKAITVERLGNWGTLLCQNHSTPVCLVAVGHDHASGTCHVIVPENMDEDAIRLFMRHAYHMVEAGMALKLG